MTHEDQVRQWYDDRKEFLGNVYVESGKRTQDNEWLAGENPQKFVADQLEAWMKDNPFPEGGSSRMTALYDVKIQEKRGTITDEEYACVTVTYLGNKAPDEFSDLAKLRKFSVNGANVSIALANAIAEIERHFEGEKGKA